MAFFDRIKIFNSIRAYLSGTPNERVFMQLNTSTVNNLAVADTYYKISGTYSTNGVNNHFSVSSDGVITYNGPGGVFLFNGVSDLQVNIVTDITYALFINQTLVPNAETPHTFSFFDRIDNISITAMVPLSTGDEIEVYAKASDNNTNLTTLNLLLTFWGR